MSFYLNPPKKSKRFTIKMFLLKAITIKYFPAICSQSVFVGAQLKQKLEQHFNRNSLLGKVLFMIYFIDWEKYIFLVIVYCIIFPGIWVFTFSKWLVLSYQKGSWYPFLSQILYSNFFIAIFATLNPICSFFGWMGS